MVRLRNPVSKNTETKNTKSKLGMVIHIFNPSTGEAEAVDFCEFEARLAYIVTSKTVRATSQKLVPETLSQNIKNKTNVPYDLAISLWHA